jgi:hypothetical protein
MWISNAEHPFLAVGMSPKATGKHSEATIAGVTKLGSSHPNLLSGMNIETAAQAQEPRKLPQFPQKMPALKNVYLNLAATFRCDCKYGFHQRTTRKD